VGWEYNRERREWVDTTPPWEDTPIAATVLREVTGEDPAADPARREVVGAMGADVSAAVSAAQVIAAHGIKRPDVTIRAAAEAGLELAAACVMLMAESGGGRMVWGSDAVSTGGTYTKGGPVTRENYLAYRDAMKAGRIGRQGVGDCQLTSAEFQDRGDALGGCWDPYANQLSGFIGLANRIRQYGTRGGFRAYNGSGPAAEAYADKRMAELSTWRARLAGVPVTPAPAQPQEEAVILTVQNAMPAGKGVQFPVIVPPYEDTAVFRMATGWTDARIRAVYFVRDAGPNMTPAQEQWGGAGPFTLVRDDRPWWDLPAGTTQVSVEYDSEHPISYAISYKPAARPR
jgi:hypothetical protein